MKLIHHSALSSATVGSVWRFASSTTPRVHVTTERRTDTLHSLYVTIRSVLGFLALTKSRKLLPLILSLLIALVIIYVGASASEAPHFVVTCFVPL
jgi:hypothetical protein